MITPDSLLPSYVSSALAGRLLGFTPPAAFNRYLVRYPEEFPATTSSRRIALIDVSAHPRRHGRPVSIEELLAADKAQESDRVRYRHYNDARKARLS